MGSVRPVTRLLCSGHAKGIDATMRVSFANEQVDKVFPLKGFVLSSPVVAHAQEQPKKRGLTATVACGPSVRLSAPGTKFACEVQGATDGPKEVYFRIESADGQVKYRDSPFP